LHEFLANERATVLDLAKTNAFEAQSLRIASEKMKEGWGFFYDELIELLESNQPFASHKEIGMHTTGAQSQGKEYLRLGYTVSEVVHSYGMICQAVTTHASEQGIEITPREFRQLNLSLDTAIAEAVTEFQNA